DGTKTAPVFDPLFIALRFVFIHWFTSPIAPLLYRACVHSSRAEHVFLTKSFHFRAAADWSIRRGNRRSRRHTGCRWPIALSESAPSARPSSPIPAAAETPITSATAAITQHHYSEEQTDALRSSSPGRRRPHSDERWRPRPAPPEDASTASMTS